MRILKKIAVGKIDGKGRLDIYTGELEAFYKMHPNRNVVVRVEVLPNATSGKLKGYYYGYILPTITRAFYELGTRYTEEQCDLFLRRECPSVGKYEQAEDGKWMKRSIPIEDMDSAEANEFIDWLKEYAVENLGCIIDDL